MMTDGTSALFSEYVEDIPWDNSPQFAFSPDTKAYLDAFRNAIELIPTRDLKIKFADDVWDFNPYMKNVNAKEYKFIFANLPKDLAEYCKFFVLHKISGKTKISTTNVRFNTFVSIVQNIFTRTSHKDIYLVTTEDIQNEIKRRNAAPSTVHNMYQSVYQMYYFLEHHYKLSLPVDLEILDKESVRWKVIDKRSETKLPDIPDPYFDTIICNAISIMRNPDIDHDNRMAAAGIVFISQTALRLGDFMALTTDRLFTKKLVKSGNETNYVHFTERKPSKAHQPLLEFDIFCNSLATEAFLLMSNLRIMSPLAKGNNYLFVLSESYNKGGLMPMPHTKTQFRSAFRQLMYKFLPVESTTPWDGINPSIYHTDPYGEKKGTAVPITLYIPDTRQFRVHLCTALYKKGVPLLYIQKYMGHLSDYMMGYYVRPKDTYQESIEETEKVIREIAGEDISPLGGNGLGSEIKENIKKFIKDKGFNVEKDIEAIVKAFGDKLIIRGKTGGVCIKTSIVNCHQGNEGRSNELLCAYNLCPNLFFFYYMIDVTYTDFQTLTATYSTMKQAGHEIAAQKELAKIKELIKRRLLPELNELDKEISIHGFDTILNRHPSLLEIMENREEIRKELETWRMKP